MQKDYIIRIVEQFVQAILAISSRRKEGKYKEAREIVQSTARYLLRIDIDVLLLFSSKHVLSHFRDVANQIDFEKCVLSADLFQEIALIEEAEHQTMNAEHLKILCLYLYTVAVPKEPQFQKPEYFAKVTSLIQNLKDQELPKEVQTSMTSYQEFVSTHYKK